MILFSDVKAAAAGRWADILAATGVPADCLSGKHCPCPACPDTTDTFRWDKTKERYCCGVADDMYKDGFDLLCRVNGISEKEALISVAEYLGIKPDMSPEAKAKARKYAKQAARIKHEEDLLHELTVLELVIGNRVNGRKNKTNVPNDTWDRELLAARRIFKLLKVIYA